MSREAPVGLTIMEKLSGLLIIVIGVILFYVTYTNMSRIGSNPAVFLALGLVLIVVGVFLVIAKAE